MLEIKKQIAGVIAGVIAETAPGAGMDADAIAALLEYPPDEKMGDLALPCFKLSKVLRCAPVKIADTLATGLDGACPCVGGRLSELLP